MTSKKDYRLSSTERPLLEQNIPSTQKRVHISFHADIHIGKKKYSNAIIGLTEHFIIPIVKGIFSGMKVSQLYHIIDIDKIDVTKENEVEIKFHNKLPSILIHSSAVIHFVRSLIRNYVLSLPLLLPHKRFIFNSYDMSQFPLFKPRLSPSQLFQLQYNTECSYLKTNYFNNVSFYIYTLLNYGNPIFNANDLPVYYTDSKFGLPFSLDPIARALAYFPFMHVFSINSIKSPNLISCAAKFATSNKSCKAIRIRNCGCTTGGKSFLEEFMNTNHDYPIYYDFSGNKLNDFPKLFKAFELITAPVETLNFEECNMNEESLLSLFNTINENENLWGLYELLIAGNYLNENCQNMLIKLMNEFQKSDILNIVTLSFGPVENIEKMTMMIDCCNQPFRHLRFYGIKITPDSAYDLIRYLKRTETLKNIEFIDCEFKDDNFQQILRSLSENENINNLSLNLSGCKLSGSKFSIFMKEVSNGLGSKLHSLSLDRNKLTLDDLVMFNDEFQNFPVLTSLQLNGNFNSGPGMNNQISRLLLLPKLESLSLNGLGISQLKGDINQLLNDLKNNNKIKHIDISKNMIGCVGYNQFLELIKINNCLITAKFSSFDMKNVSDAFEILEVVSHHKSLCNICLFRDDAIRLLSGQPPQVLQKYSELLVKAQIRNMENCALINAVPGEFEFAQTSLSSITDASVSTFLKLGGAGIGGGGISTGCPSIDDQDVFLAGVLDDSVYELNETLKFVKPPKNQHLKMIHEFFGIQFPYNQENKIEPAIYGVDLDNYRDGFAKENADQNIDTSKIEKSDLLYVCSSLFGSVVDNSNDPSQDTLLCKSVLERRPKLAEELKDFDPSMILVQPSMKYKEEDEDEPIKHKPQEDTEKSRVNVADHMAPTKPTTRRRQTIRPEHSPTPPKLEDLFQENGEVIQNHEGDNKPAEPKE